MFRNIKLKDYGPIESLRWKNLGKINVIIGSNGCGKTYILKSLYCAIKTAEAHKRGKDQRTAAEILANKLYWTFQTTKIGDLVRKKSQELDFSATIDGKKFEYKFGRETRKTIAIPTDTISRGTANSIFLPAKEVISLYKIILESRENDQSFGFDDTYYDLAKAILKQTTKGKNIKEFSTARNHLEEMIGGKVRFDESARDWIFTKENFKFYPGVTSEGIKKVSILDTLLGNRYLSRKSVIFIDEPESALHPKAIHSLLDIVSLLADAGIQFFMATHSYFVIKCLRVLATRKKMSIPILSCNESTWTADDLLKGMPDNEIINESIRLYKEEVSAEI